MPAYWRESLRNKDKAVVVPGSGDGSLEEEEWEKCDDPSYVQLCGYPVFWKRHLASEGKLLGAWISGISKLDTLP